jgi:hypothetical protein
VFNVRSKIYLFGVVVDVLLLTGIIGPGIGGWFPGLGGDPAVLILVELVGHCR